jgi:hypothetical protein
MTRTEQRLAEATRARLEAGQPCETCDHSKSAHDTGWDAAGCMAAGCGCRSFVPVAPKGPAAA